MFKIILFLCAASSIVIVLFIFGYMLQQGGMTFVGWILNGIWNHSVAGAPFPYIFNTVYCSLAGALIGFAIGLPCAIYLSEFSNFKLRNFVKPALEVLMGFPSVVMGLLILVLFMQNYTHKPSFRSGNMHFAAFIVLGIMALPIIVSVSEDSLRAVPQEQREASFGLGATRWQTATKVIIPGAFSGISVAFLLGTSRCHGRNHGCNFSYRSTYPSTSHLKPFSRIRCCHQLKSPLCNTSWRRRKFILSCSWFSSRLFILTIFTNLL